MSGSFLSEPETTSAVQAMYDEDLGDDGFVWNVTRLWAHQPETQKDLFRLMSAAFAPARMELRQRGILVAATASTMGDSYCSLAWGGKLSGFASSDLAAAVLSGSDDGLTDVERAIAAWARKVVKDPNATTAADIDELRGVGLDDDQIFAVTLFVALRLAFSTVNDALGAFPDAQLVQTLPDNVVSTVTYGRPAS